MNFRGTEFGRRPVSKFIAAAFLAFAFASDARISNKDYMPPRLGTLAEQATFLGFLSEELPDLFSEGTEYDVDLFQFLTWQQQAVEYLSAQPAYVEALKNRGPLLEVDVTRMVKVKSKTTVTIHPFFVNEAVERWKDVESNPRKSQERALSKLREDVTQFASDFGAFNVRGALTGLISLLPKEDRGSLFRRHTEEQVDLLKTDPHFSQLESEFSKFRFKDVGLEKQSLAEVLEELGDARHAFDRMKKHIVSTLLAEDIAANGGGNEAARSQAVLEAALIHSKEVPPIFGDLGTDPGFLQGWEDLKREAVSRLGGEALPESHLVLRLKEAPGYLATLRGFVGVDCATQYSFAYGLLPAERTFFIYDPEGANIGYVMATELLWQGKPALYVHDFSGPRISPEIANRVLFALQNVAQSLGMDHIVVPTAKNSFRNVNFKPIRAVMDTMAGLGKVGNLTYPDAGVRGLMTGVPVGIDHNYDSPEANKQAHSVPEIKVGLTTSIRNASWPKHGNTALTGKQTAILALEVDYPSWSVWSMTALQNGQQFTEAPAGINLQRLNAATQLVASAGLADPHMVVNARSVLPNPQRTTGDAYLQQVSQVVGRNGVTVDDLLENHRHLLYEGILQTSDVFATGSARLNRLAMDAVRAAILHRGQAMLVQPIVEEHFEAFRLLPEIDELIRDLVRDREEHLSALEWFVGHGVSINLVGPHLAKLQEIASNSLNTNTREVAARILKFIADDPDFGSASCAQSLLEKGKS